VSEKATTPAKQNAKNHQHKKSENQTVPKQRKQYTYIHEHTTNNKSNPRYPQLNTKETQG